MAQVGAAPFTWVLFSHPETPADFKARLTEYARRLPFIRIEPCAEFDGDPVGRPGQESGGLTSPATEVGIGQAQLAAIRRAPPTPRSPRLSPSPTMAPFTKSDYIWLNGEL